MRQRARDELRLRPYTSRTQARVRRLRRATERWQLCNEVEGVNVRRVAFGTLTAASEDQTAVVGAIRDFWHRVRQEWPGTRYFCWLELQARGQVHYHWFWLNPPHRKKVDLLAAVDRWWVHGRTQVRFLSSSTWARRGTEYAMSYVKSKGPKAYQQQYDALEVPLRTFMMQRGELLASELEQHLATQIARYVPEGRYGGEHLPAYVLVVAELEHVPIGEELGVRGAKGMRLRRWCSLAQDVRRRRGRRSA